MQYIVRGGFVKILRKYNLQAIRGGHTYARGGKMKTIHMHKMTHSLFCVAAFSTALFCSVGATQEINKDGAEAGSIEKSDRECRTSRSIGSKIRRSQCLSKEEWALVDARQQELEKESQKNKDEYFRRTIQRGGLIRDDALDNPNTP
ncbi:MAG: hypothetical protein A3G96_03025 [Gammaproteobacteria bacterium RIFCSPLOWO2_12_FULL_52_10]|nr:MAG: hypothetical protein A3G96_03025 [Gammaproteobacteria bacterium RIFCSPLOWO2_12_FULL_52_10]